MTMEPMQAGFGKLVARLQLVDYNILDVRNMAWYDDFSAFRSGVRSLEVRLSNVMQLAVDSAGSLSARVELLEARQTPTVLSSSGPAMPKMSSGQMLGMSACMHMCVCANLLAVLTRVPDEGFRFESQVAMTCRPGMCTSPNKPSACPVAGPADHVAQPRRVPDPGAAHLCACDSLPKRAGGGEKGIRRSTAHRQRKRGRRPEVSWWKRWHSSLCVPSGCHAAARAAHRGHLEHTPGDRSHKPTWSMRCLISEVCTWLGF